MTPEMIQLFFNDDSLGYRGEYGIKAAERIYKDIRYAYIAFYLFCIFVLNIMS